MGEIVTLLAEWCALIIEAVGIVIITFIALYSLAIAAMELTRRENRKKVFQEMRQRLGQGILLGLEFLIAADIINTVALDLTWEAVGILGLIVVIRTFLSFALEVELNGRWPWQERAPESE
jgi:uncharacterized membrane protein